MSLGSATAGRPAFYHYLRPSGSATADTAAMQAALDACKAVGRGEIVIDGLLQINATLTYTQASSFYWYIPDRANAANLLIRGFGPYGCGFQSSTITSTDLLELGSSGNPCYGVTLRDLSIGSTAAQSSHTAGYGVRCYGNNILIDHCSVSGYNDAIGLLGGGAFVQVRNCEIDSPARNGIVIDASNSGGTDPGNDWFITDCIMAGANAATGSGILWKNRDAVCVTHCDIVGFTHGLLVQPTRTANPGSGIGTFLGCFFDTSIAEGVYIDGTNLTGGIQFTDCWASFSGVASATTSSGVRVTGGAQRSIRWSGGKIISNGGYGVQLDSGHDFAIENAIVMGNQQGGVYAAALTTEFKVTGCRMTSQLTSYSSTFLQPYGIVFDPTFSAQANFIIKDNDLRGHATAATSGPLDSTTGIVKDNLGYNPRGTVGPPSMPATTVALTNPYSQDCTAYVTGGTVTVIKVGGSTTGITSGAVRVAAGQTITLTYSVAPSWVWIAD